MMLLCLIGKMLGRRGSLCCSHFYHIAVLTGIFFFFSLKYIGSITKNEVCRGYGGFGALGHSVYHRELFPRLVEGSWNGKMQHIATSGAHTAAITESGFFFLTYPFFIYIYMDIPSYVYSVWFGF